MAETPRKLYRNGAGLCLGYEVGGGVSHCFNTIAKPGSGNLDIS